MTTSKAFSSEHTINQLQDYSSNLPEYLANNGITTEIVKEAIKEKETRIFKAPYFVSMTDKYMSNWGMAANKTNKLIIACDDFKQAQSIARNAEKRKEMKYINICSKKPQIKSNQYPSWKHFEDMGEIWTK